MRIGKNHPVLELLKQIHKTNHYPNLIYSDDLEVLKIASGDRFQIPYLLYSFEEKFQAETEKLLETLKNKAEETFEISTATYKKFASKENHAAILAVIELPQTTLDQLSHRDFIVVLDRLEIPGNIGTIYRTLDACSAEGVLLVDPITKRQNPKITAAARGTNLLIPTVEVSYSEALSFLLKEGYTIYLGEPLLGQDYQSYDYKGKIAIVVGNERFGIQNDWYAHPHQKVYIPMQGYNNSLNVSVAASILAYEAAMKRGLKKETC